MFTEEINWDLLLRESITAQAASPLRHIPIPPISRPFSSSYLIVECSSTNALPHWWLGARASVNLLFTPSSFTSFPALTEFLRKNCALGRKTLIEIPSVGVSPYMLILEIPPWLSQISLAVWYYNP